MNQYTSFFGKCKSAASILQKRRARNAEWEDNLRHPERFLHQKVNRDGMKRCACCGRLFKPTRFHEDDQLYCKDDECKRQRDNYRARKAYKERVSTREGKIEHYQKSKAKRTMVEEAIGIEHSEDKYARKRNAVRRKLEEMKEKNGWRQNVRECKFLQSNVKNTTVLKSQKAPQNHPCNSLISKCLKGAFQKSLF